MRREPHVLWLLVIPVLAMVLSSSGCALRPAAGEAAPTFSSAVLVSGGKADLASLMGEKGVVLYFYPKDETPGCTTQACTFQEKLIDFQNQGFNVVGVSVDTEESHKKFQSAHNINFPLIADTDKALAKLYNVPTETDPVGSYGFRRTTFVITKDGIVRQRFEDPDPKQQVNEAMKSVSQPF